MINLKYAEAYCSEDISKIENYALAVADSTQTWDCHHRLEIQGQFKNSPALLKRCGLYYHVPAWQLIFLTHGEHKRLHRLGEHHSEETRKKMSAVLRGKHHSEETRKKMSLSHIGKRMSEESRKKLSAALSGKRKSEEAKRKMSDKALVRFSDKRNHPNFGRHLSDETKKKLSEKAKARFANPENHPMFGKHLSESSKKKISESNRGRAAWNRGISPSEESRKRMSEAHKGTSPSESTRAKQSEIMKKKVWVTNGAQNLRVDPASIPNGWTRGRTRLSN